MGKIGLTVRFIVAVLGLIIVYDTYTLMANGYATTISAVLGLGAEKVPIVAVAIGVVVGHLFGGTPRTFVALLLGVAGGRAFWPNRAVTLDPGAVPTPAKPLVKPFER